MYAPFFEIDQHWEDGTLLDSITQKHKEIGIQLFNTHLPWEYMPKSECMKYIYVIRNGKDVCTSFYHHLSNQSDNGGFEGSFTTFNNQWLNGSLPYGRWLIHVHDWFAASKENSNILIIFYEDLIYNLPECLIKIANHLHVTVDESMMRDILPSLSFVYMKEHMSSFQPISVKWKEGFSFIRKGVVGDSKNLFGDGENRQFNEMIRKLFPDSDKWPEWLLKVIR